MTFRPPCEKPCGQCPFRRASLSGWLGSAAPERFVSSVHADVPLPCHKTLNYTDPAWNAKWLAQRIGKICAGSLIYASNIAHRPRDRRAPTMPANHQLVFSSDREFINHHRRDGWPKSWIGTDDEYEAVFEAMAAAQQKEEDEKS